MIKIGISKLDSSFRHFYFDDSHVLTSNPPKYKIWYVDDEEKEIKFINCSDVIAIKNAPDEMQVDKTPVQPEPVKINGDNLTTQNPSPIKVESSDITATIKIEEPKKEPKKRGRKKKETTTQTPSTQIIVNSKYEYKVIDEELYDDEELETILNEYGDEGWEVCGFETYKDKFITNTVRIICILKRIKIN